MQSSYIENLGNNDFKMSSLPREVQIAPIFGALSIDVDQDDNLDVMLVGNDYGNNVYWGRYDAFNGAYLKGNGRGEFEVKTYPESGFFVEGDAKALVHLPLANGESLLIASQNQDSLKSFLVVPPQIEKASTSIILEDMDAYADLRLKDGSIRKV